MKYWDELNQLDTTLVELDLIKSNLRVIANGAESSFFEDLQSAIECVTSNLEEKMAEARENFEVLFSNVRSDGDEETVSTLKTNEYVTPSEDVIELDRIVRGWGQK